MLFSGPEVGAVLERGFVVGDEVEEEEGEDAGGEVFALALRVASDELDLGLEGVDGLHEVVGLDEDAQLVHEVVLAEEGLVEAGHVVVDAFAEREAVVGAAALFEVPVEVTWRCGRARRAACFSSWPSRT